MKVNIFQLQLIMNALLIAPCSDGDLRLAGGNVANEGRVEVCMDNEWGTICDDSWGTSDANVACKQLGFSSTGLMHTDDYKIFASIYLSVNYIIDAVAFSNAHFGAGSGSIFLDGLGCTGSESSLLDCSKSSTISCYYGHSEDAGVRCFGKDSIKLTSCIMKVEYYLCSSTWYLYTWRYSSGWQFRR